MEEMEVEDGAGARKRKRDGGEEVASVAGAGAVVVLPVSGEAALEGGGCFSWKELSLREECSVAEESVEEVMRWLETEISSPPPTTGKGDDDGYGYGFVTINGNEESCGPSFSAAASTVMASIDTRLGAPPPPTPIPWPWPEPDSSTRDDQEMAEACADGIGEEEWLLDLLTAAGPALEVFGLD